MRKSNQELLNQKCWIKVSEDGIKWLNDSFDIINIPDCDMYFNKNGRDVSLYDNKRDILFQGSIKERFVGPDKDTNLKEIKEFLSENHDSLIHSDSILAIGIKEKIPNYGIAEDWFIIKFTSIEKFNKFNLYVLAKKCFEYLHALEEKENG